MQDRVARQRVHVSAFLSEHCLPFSLASDTLELSKCLAKDKPALERVTLSPGSVTYINTHGLAKSFKEELKLKMKSRFVSLNLE
ncbi:hypothetical protein DPMN_087791 [Dreissena polymorpha]|uniref:Uncharacterized protein n=1 Tax=Dreissena polymorpha TaxID=45954 RepID=A0A9D4KSZ9_DREPO|nr:hypothetical protein DPMN_087791 [Dreissena polymorpha]